jgi:hypothetical protein
VIDLRFIIFGLVQVLPAPNRSDATFGNRATADVASLLKAFKLNGR